MLLREGSGCVVVHSAARASGEHGNYVDPNLDALCEAVSWSRNDPPGTRDIRLWSWIETAGRKADGLPGKPLCTSVIGFPRHAASFVPACDREASERFGERGAAFRDRPSAIDGHP